MLEEFLLRLALLALAFVEGIFSHGRLKTALRFRLCFSWFLSETRISIYMILIHEMHVFDDLTCKKSLKTRMWSMLIGPSIISSVSRIAFWKSDPYLRWPKVSTFSLKVGQYCPTHLLDNKGRNLLQMPEQVSIFSCISHGLSLKKSMTSELKYDFPLTAVYFPSSLLRAYTK